jgi:hypothetical protein
MTDTRKIAPSSSAWPQSPVKTILTYALPGAGKPGDSAGIKSAADSKVIDATGLAYRDGRRSLCQDAVTARRSSIRALEGRIAGRCGGQASMRCRMLVRRPGSMDSLSRARRKCACAIKRACASSQTACVGRATTSVKDHARSEARETIIQRTAACTFAIVWKYPNQPISRLRRGSKPVAARRHKE